MTTQCVGTRKVTGNLLVIRLGHWRFSFHQGVTEGYNGTIFAYGQTGSGKSFTMQGVAELPAYRGVIPRAFEHIFETIQVSQYLLIVNIRINNVNLGVRIKFIACYSIAILILTIEGTNFDYH